MLLLRYLQTVQHFSRRSVIDLIKQEKILINGKKVEAFKQELQEGDEIRILSERKDTAILRFHRDGVPQEEGGDQPKQRLLLFNKPKGYVVSKSDPHNQTIYELLPPEFQHYYYIGRLDKESRGLLLLTDSPEIVHLYEHPRFNIEKEYLIQLSSPLSSTDQQQAKSWIRVGMESGKGGKSGSEILKFKEISPTGKKNQYRIRLNEGKKRHIRRVIKALGYELVDLQRVKEGEYALGNLQEGGFLLV